MKIRTISRWDIWKKIGEIYNFDPYENVDFGMDTGGGNDIDFEYIGDIPEKDHDEESKNARDAYSGVREEE